VKAQNLGAWLNDPDAVRDQYAENGANALRRHFARVEVRDAGGSVVIRARDAIDRYIRSIKAWAPFAERLPEKLEAPLVATRATSVFVATA
jgi:hypothetical protein